jgi:short-subunit dehydrogenase
MKKYSLTNKTVLITGASSGIGEALVSELAKKSKRIILASRNINKLKEIKLRFSGLSEILIYQLDLTNNLSINNFLNEIQNSRLDVIIHNAGISQRSYAAKTNEEVESKVWDTNYFGPVLLTKKLLPLLKKNERSKIVIISSIVEVFGYPLRSTYSATKHALKGYFESLYIEEHQAGVEIHFALPGRVKTSISENAFTANGDQHNKMDKGQAVGISPESCAKQIVDGISSGKKKNLIGGKELLMVKLYRYFPTLFFNIAKKELVQ